MAAYNLPVNNYSLTRHYVVENKKYERTKSDQETFFGKIIFNFRINNYFSIK